ncbi:arylesterase [Pedobacter metabolipauper]|uniref:Acyl-CoA thioesterase-1 n=1 Tax=Pedobacter metabolipauper TaxID=425513 RepID=A0A4R6SZF9_9SPHI|nr:arylesterase [Pedobacter metabolipauper]TDQ10132.1 acyl-CoA thioesterase-1 [Pedobacter metabolipauper]
MLRNTSTLIITFLAIFFSSCGNSSKNGDKETAKVSDTTATSAAAATAANKKKILFFGTSLTAGLGLEDPNEAYPNLIQQKIDAINLPYHVVNAGLSGETSAAGKSRIGWVLKQPISIFVLELGANDGLRGVSVSETTRNLQSIIDTVKNKYPEAKMVLAGMQIPPNMGEKYASDFKDMFKQLAVKNKMTFVPFLLEGVGGIPALNQNDGIHPTAEGQKILAKNVWVKLKEIL